MTMEMRRIARVTIFALATLASGTAALAQDKQSQTPLPQPQNDTNARYSANEITQAGADFFGITTEAMAKAVQHIFGDLGQPDAYIKGDEGSGAFIVGLRYGSGWLIRKTREPLQTYWRGPSIGFDAGANASKCFTLIYNLKEDRRLFQRYPGVEGSFYVVAGLGINYMRSGGVTLAPMRTGIGLRAGVNAHYQVYSDRRDWFPL